MLPFKWAAYIKESYTLVRYMLWKYMGSHKLDIIEFNMFFLQQLSLLQMPL